MSPYCSNRSLSLHSHSHSHLPFFRPTTTVLPVLIIKPEWLELILAGEKRWEIRGARHLKHVGRTVYLAASESAAISGRAMLVGCHGPLSKSEWTESFELHRVPSGELVHPSHRRDVRPYGIRTYAWEFGSVQRAQHPISFTRNEAVIFQNVKLQTWQVEEAIFGSVAPGDPPPSPPLHGHNSRWDRLQSRGSELGSASTSSEF
jgi:hypothetical protein